MFKSLFSRSASLFIIIETPCLLTYIKLIEQFLTLFISNISIFVERVYNIFYEHQFSSVAQSCLTLCDPMNRSTPGLPVHHQLLESTQTHVHRVGDAIQPSHLLSSLFPPAPIPPSIRVFSNESTLLMRWPKYWSFSFGIIPSKEHPGLISFRMNWLDLLEVHGALKSHLQHHNSKASILRHSAWELGNYIVLPMNRSLRAFLALLKMIRVSH